MDFRKAFILAVLAATLWGTPQNMKIVGQAPPMKKGPQVRFSRAGKVIPSRYNFGVNRDGCLKRRLTEPLHLRFLVARVEFQPDHNTRSTGDGTMNLAPADSFPYPIDPTPHNFWYFAAQMKALRNYWLLVSDSLIYIDYDIFPIPGDDEAYRLPDSMAYYGPNGWFGDNLSARMGAFFQDAWELVVSEEPSIDLHSYDAFILFHAGTDMQNDIGSIEYYHQWDPETFVPSPDDLPTGVITFDSPVVDGVISEGLIAPEYVSQDGQIVAMNGVMAHECGHLLGLVDLYSTYDFSSAVGYFSLMDNGHILGVQVQIDSLIYPVYGALPTYPSAWDRAFLGIEPPIAVSDSGTYNVGACEFVHSDTTILKIPINEYEYYLVECRSAVGDGRPVALKEDSSTGVVQGIVDYDTDELLPFYDYLLPGSGMLIWHIDEAVAYMDYTGDGKNNFDENTLQWDRERRFVSLVEADGIPGFGYYYGYYGDSLDFFFAGNNDAFTPTSHPATRANDGAYTGIHIDNIGAQGVLMLCRVWRELGYPLWQRITGYPVELAPAVADVNGDGSEEIAVAVSNALLAWRADGEKLIPNNDTLGLIDFSGDTAHYPFPVAAILDTDIVVSPVFADIDGNGIEEIVVATKSGRFYGFDPIDDNGDGRADQSVAIQLDGIPSGTPIAADIDTASVGEEMLIYCSNGMIELISGSGDILWEIDSRGYNDGLAILDDSLLFITAENVKGRLYRWRIGSSSYDNFVQTDENGLSAPILCDIDNDGAPDIIFTSDDGYIYSYSTELLPKTDFPVSVGDSNLSAPIAIDIDDDGYKEIIFSSSNKIYAVRHSGILEENFPAKVLGYSVSYSSPPSSADVNGDGEPDIVQGSALGNVYAFDRFGRLIDGFPLSANSIETKIIASDVDGNNHNELVVASMDGSLSLFSLPESRALPPASALLAPNGTILDNPYQWPNPGGEVVHIRFGLREAVSTVSLAVFTQDGLRVAQLEIPNPLVGEPNEMDWNTVGVPSGIYYGVLTASGEKKIIKMAIVK